MAGSNMDDARVRSLPLSSNMLAILGSLLSAIDRRVAGFKEAQLWGNIVEDPKLGAMTCDMCCGTGFVLVEVETGTMTDHVDGNMKSRRAQKGPAGGSMDPAPGYPPSPEIPMSDEMCSFLNVKQAPASGTLGPSVSGISVATPTAASTAGHAVTVTSFPPLPLHSLPFLPLIRVPLPILPLPLPLFPLTLSPIPLPTLLVLLPLSPLLSPLLMSLLLSPPPGLTLPTMDPLFSLLPAWSSLGFTPSAFSTPFLSRRTPSSVLKLMARLSTLSHMGSVDMVAPYVVKAAGVAYGKKPSLAAAYEAYAKAYERPGAIQYI
ncbi:hypothetical protein NMY22_g19085 [Coprinellus aureogranulatus]|nr:hypothetical protein NMY22_g19085 [Coprinellus aureogranulatus]